MATVPRIIASAIGPVWINAIRSFRRPGTHPRSGDNAWAFEVRLGHAFEFFARQENRQRLMFHQHRTFRADHHRGFRRIFPDPFIGQGDGLNISRRVFVAIKPLDRKFTLFILSLPLNIQVM